MDIRKGILWECLRLRLTKRTDEKLLERMRSHYSQPKGFVGRSLCYSILLNEEYLGHIIAGSATLHLAPRDNYLASLGITKGLTLNNIVNNVFYDISKPVSGKYPKRNFTSIVLKFWRKQVVKHWEQFYGDKVLIFESLVELPRTGELYLKDGWNNVGVTKGYNCKRTSGKGTDNWSGRRVWDTKNLRPKRIFVKIEERNPLGIREVKV